MVISISCIHDTTGRKIILLFKMQCLIRNNRRFELILQNKKCVILNELFFLYVDGRIVKNKLPVPNKKKEKRTRVEFSSNRKAPADA